MYSALAACLYFPFLRNRTATFPFFKPYSKAEFGFSIFTELSPFIKFRCDVVFGEGSLLSYYTILSCNVWGMQALFCNIFFDFEISCNVVSPWLKPIFKIINFIVKDDRYEILIMIIDKRQFKFATLWLNVIIVGVKKPILQTIHFGLSTMKLHAAAWTATVQSFIELEPSAPSVINENKIRRSDECRLLYITDCDGHSRMPVCPWKSFGTTSLCYTEIEVRQHAKCIEHCLQYVSWRWNSVDDMISEDEGFNVNADYCLTSAAMNNLISTRSLRVRTPTFEILSKLATQSIFSWLWINDYASDENNIYKHEWLNLEESDDEQIEDDSSTWEQLASPLRPIYIKNCFIDQWYVVG